MLLIVNKSSLRVTWCWFPYGKAIFYRLKNTKKSSEILWFALYSAINWVADCCLVLLNKKSADAYLLWWIVEIRCFNRFIPILPTFTHNNNNDCRLHSCKISYIFRYNLSKPFIYPNLSLNDNHVHQQLSSFFWT